MKCALRLPGYPLAPASPEKARAAPRRRHSTK